MVEQPGGCYRGEEDLITTKETTMTPYYLYEIAITGIFDDLFIALCITVYYFLNKWDRRNYHGGD